MKFFSSTAKALAAMAMIVPAFSAQAAANATQAAPAAAEKVETKICKKLETTGTRLRARKLCLTADQWKKFDVEDM